tara:strand:+ start:1437 stop:2102 length:666 start_codon:yes stop_codon:yes gene_type:complete
MHINVKRLESVIKQVKEIANKKQLKTIPKIIAVSKTFSSDQITPLLDFGHIHFGENKVQEAESKWKDIKKKYNNVQLHMLGKLQTNKSKIAVNIFDYIHSLDNAKLALKISQFEKELNKKVKLFIQVNIGEEKQKSGILIKDLENFYDYCTNQLSLNIIGLMCIPPLNVDPKNYFSLVKKNSEMLHLKDLSMGMSSDFEEAILYGSTYLRLGSVIFGERSS